MAQPRPQSGRISSSLVAEADTGGRKPTAASPAS